MKEEFDFESIKNKAIEQLKAGKPLLGKDGAFAPLLESIPEFGIIFRIRTVVLSPQYSILAKGRML